MYGQDAELVRRGLEVGEESGVDIVALHGLETGLAGFGVLC